MICNFKHFIHFNIVITTNDLPDAIIICTRVGLKKTWYRWVRQPVACRRARGGISFMRNVAWNWCGRVWKELGLNMGILLYMKVDGFVARYSAYISTYKSSTCDVWNLFKKLAVENIQLNVSWWRHMETLIWVSIALGNGRWYQATA